MALIFSAAAKQHLLAGLCGSDGSPFEHTGGNSFRLRYDEVRIQMTDIGMSVMFWWRGALVAWEKYDPPIASARFSASGFIEGLTIE